MLKWVTTSRHSRHSLRVTSFPCFHALLHAFGLDPVESDVFKCQTPPVDSDVFKCQTPPVESSAVVRVDVWKCERYKKNRYDPMAKVPMKGEKVKPFLYGRVVVFQLKGNSGSVVG
jgi:hypothetical protein